MHTDITIPIVRVAWGALVAAIIAAGSAGLRVLTPGGAIAAFLVGTTAMAAGWKWGVTLAVFFVSSVALTRIGSATKLARAAGRIDKPGARDAAQVVANGGVFALGALAAVLTRQPVLVAAALGALAAATGDTWATEVGILSTEEPRSFPSFDKVAAGMSGGVTTAGLLAGVAGAAAIALCGHLLSIDHAAPVAVAAGGTAGMLFDSILGAVAQSERWCDACGAKTERVIHDCGTRTRHVRGISWLRNDGVNALATLSGAAVAGAVAWRGVR
ncbi:MAG TPA: DUF92 domain-containing protein [Gemmatimonadaceae bacterium]|nr:DUF92 domain-containing protein [Gemmatimonadaceae bacterium]